MPNPVTWFHPISGTLQPGTFGNRRTLPGRTPNSLIPKAAAVAGMSYPELCEKIVTLSLAERGK